MMNGPRQRAWPLGILRLPIPLPLEKGVAKAALYCAHRTTSLHLIDPSKLAHYLLPRGGLGPQLRMSNDHCFIVGIP